MEIKAISNFTPAKVSFSARKRKQNNTTPTYNRDNNISGHHVTKALRNMVLIPIVASGPFITSCSDKPIIEDSCNTIIMHDGCCHKPHVPAVKDTLYMGHLYNLPSIKMPVRDMTGAKKDTVMIPATQAYIPLSLKDSPTLSALDDLMDALNLKSTGVTPKEGKNKALIEGLPLQMAYSNPATQTVTAIKFDGFDSVENTFAFNSVEYNKEGHVKSSTHFDITYAGDKSLFVEKKNNFKPEQASTTELWQIKDTSVERFVNIGNNRFELRNIYNKGYDAQTVFISGNDDATEIKDIKIKSSDI